MAVERDNPYIYVTWLTKLMSGENQCQWASWFKAHHKNYEKVPSDFDSAKWTAEHNELLQRRVAALRKEGFTVYTEEQNAFTLKGQNGITVSGKADIVAIKNGIGFVEDCKTGSQRNSDQIQVAIYMIALPLKLPHCKGMKLNGRVIYKNAIVDVPAEKVDDGMRELFKRTVHAVGGIAPLTKVPSYKECRWCDIAKQECSERVENKAEPVDVEHELF